MHGSLFRRMIDNVKVSYELVDQLIQGPRYPPPSHIDHSPTLEVQLPNIFAGSLPLRASMKDKSDTVTLPEQPSQSKINESKISYYSLVKMMFPETQAIPALAIHLMDTIFYNFDGSMTYVYTDPRRGLTKTKTKNYIDMFLKRKQEVDGDPSKTSKRVQLQPQLQPQLQLQLQANLKASPFLKQLDYIALLRYKDENFLRLKQHEFKSIFIRPVQANQKYKISNNTLYLQLIPQEINQLQGTIFNVQFQLERVRGTRIFGELAARLCRESVRAEIGALMGEIRGISVQAYLLCIVIEIYTYISVHHHRQLTFGIFEFMRVADTFYLSNARQLRINDSEDVKNQYASHNLFDQFLELQSHVQGQGQSQGEGQEKQSGLINAFSGFFSQENQKICSHVRGFMDRKVAEVEDKDDQLQSNLVFQSINSKSQHNLHHLLANDNLYEKFLKKKQKQLDGFSPLTSISNISRKRQTRQTRQTSQIQPSKKPNSTQKKPYEKSPPSSSNPFFLAAELRRNRPTTSKWVKKSIHGKREYFVQKN